MNLGALLQGEMFAVFLTFCRVGSALMVVPGFGEPYVMSRLRLCLALGTSLIIGFVHQPELPSVPDEAATFVALVAIEVVLGLFIGATVRLVLVAAHMAGGVIAMQSGLASAAFFDPSGGTQGSGIGNYLTMLTLTLIFVTNGHLLILEGLDRSYDMLPVGKLMPDDMALTFSRLSADAIAMATRIAAPMLLVGIISNLLMGILNRLMPSFQVMFVIMPLQIMLAFAIVALSLGVTATLSLQLFETSLTWLDGPGG
ncbi:MAG: flagellar biosynthetic protein FliR [Geminicoccaceae bacterium]|nr:flagellar biosynthetic protein FliR [Geminicoccaceae bacterium]